MPEHASSLRLLREPQALFYAFSETVSMFLKSAKIRLQQPKDPLRIPRAHACRP